MLVRYSRSIFKKIIGKLGFEIRRLPVKTFNDYLKTLNIQTVLDVGANEGQFATRIHNLLPEAKIYSFEPLDICFKELESLKFKINNLTAFNIALGSTKGVLTFNFNDFSPSSSFLEVSDELRKNYPFVGHSKKIEVNCERLDDKIKELEINENILLKIDTQGFEDKVIIGGKSTIKMCTLLIIETSFIELYKEQPLFFDVCEFLKDDFFYMGSLSGSRNSKIDGRPLFEDSIFLNKRKI